MKKTFASAVTAVFLAIILATVAFAAPAAKNNGVPFKGTFQATETTVVRRKPPSMGGPAGEPWVPPRECAW